MIETIKIKTLDQFNDWKKTKLRKDWQASTILFTCEICEKEISVRGRNFRDFICRLCRKSKTESSKSEEAKLQELQKRKKTLLEKYGTESLINIPGVKEKCKQIFLDKYGVENPAQSKEVQTIIKKHNIEKYGVESTNQVEFIKEKQNKKRLQSWKNNKGDIVGKKRKTLKERYGDPFYSNPVQCKQTKKEKYGDENYNNQEKIKQTNLERYGNERWIRTEEGRQKSRNQWLYMSKESRKAQLQKCKETWSNKTSEEKKAIRQKTIKKYGCYYIQTEEGRNKVKEYWKNLSVEEKHQRSNKCKETWFNKTPEEKKALRQKAVKKYWDWWSTLSEEEQIAWKKEIRQKSIKKYWYDKSIEERLAINKKRSETYQNKTLEEKRAIRFKACKKYKTNNSLEMFDSSWELAVWIYAKDNSIDIVREPVGLEYVHDGKKRTYYPDFLFEGKLIEIKGTHFFKEDGTMQNPFDHSKDALFEAKHQCGLRHGVLFWGKEDVQFALNYMEQEYGKNWVQLFTLPK